MNSTYCYFNNSLLRMDADRWIEPCEELFRDAILSPLDDFQCFSDVSVIDTCYLFVMVIDSGNTHVIK